MSEIVVRQIEQHHVPGMYLGRHVEHDPASRDYPAEMASQLKSVLHKRVAPIFDQGDIGSCTGNAAAGALGTEPFTVGDSFGEKEALTIYEQGTKDDDISGSYPPDDTGSSGLGVAKACKSFGYIRTYRHAFGLDHALRALAIRPVIIGINWYDSFDKPGANGLITISSGASVRGGHEVELLGLDVDAKNVRGANSWSSSWGDNGFFEMSWEDFDRLLHEQGDVTVFYA